MGEGFHWSWPTYGTLLWVGRPSPSLEASPIFQFACSVVCQGEVRHQHLLEAKTHPDFYLVEPMRGSHWIKVDQIRELISWAQVRPQVSSRKAALIYPADALNLQAANALLKILEEAMPELLFVLISANPRTLPRTLLSRCHWIRDRSLRESTSNLDCDRVSNDLRRLKAKEIDPSVLAEEWLKQDLGNLVTGLFVVWRDALSSAVQAGEQKQARFMLGFLDKIYEARRGLQEKIPVNNQLLIESLLVQYILCE